jgi:ArsR family transcriptional regulator
MTSTSVDSTDVDALAEGFSALGDPIRLQVLGLLAGGKCCVCDLRDEIDIAQNLLSYHLKVLREAGLVTASRRGRWVDYELAGPALAALQAAVPAGEAE